MAQQPLYKTKPLSAIRGSSYLETIKDQLNEERAAKVSLEQRGVTIITTSGALATLLFGFGAFVYGKSIFRLGPEGTSFLICALVLFVAAAIFGLVTNQPSDYEASDTRKLLERVEANEWYKDSPAMAAQRDAKLYVELIKAYRSANSRKARQLYWGVVSEVLAVACVAASLIRILGSSGASDASAAAFAILTLVAMLVLWGVLRWRLKKRPDALVVSLPGAGSPTGGTAPD